MSNITLIGFCGLAGVGKTMAARWLQEECGFDRIAFAAPLKAMCRKILSVRQMAGDLKEVPCHDLCGKTPRQFMQLLGTEFGRDLIGGDFWVRQWHLAVEQALLDDITRIVADDVRFANEADAIRALGGKLVRLVRAGAGSASGPGHASERDDLAADVTLHVGDIDDLRRQVRGLEAAGRL